MRCFRQPAWYTVLAAILAAPASSQLGPCTIETVAGGRSFIGDERPALEAEFFSPESMRLAADGSLYVADTFHNVIRKVAPEGTITTVAGTGEPGSSGDGGPATQARLKEPRSLALGPDGSYYFIESLRVRRVGPDGIIATVAGDGSSGLGPDELPATETGLPGAEHVTVDTAGNIYISSPTAHRVWKVTTDGIAHHLAGRADPADPRGAFSGDGGLAREAELDTPSDLVVDADGNLYIADRDNDRIRRVDSRGIIETYLGGGNSSADGVHQSEAHIFRPFAIEIDAEGRLYWPNGRSIRRVGSDKRLETVLEVSDLFLDVLSVSPLGEMHVAYAHRIFRLLAPNAYEVVAGAAFPTPRGEGGPATDAVLGDPRGLAAGLNGEIYIADAAFRRVWRFPPGGLIERVFGTGFLGFSGDGGPAISATTVEPRDVALDSAGNLYVLTGRGRVRKVDTTGIVSTFAGTGESCAPFPRCGEGGPALEADLPEPLSLAIDSQDNMYILHAGHGIRPTTWVRRVNTAGIIERLPVTGIPEESLPSIGFGFALAPTGRVVVTHGGLDIPYFQRDPGGDWTPVPGSQSFAGPARVLAVDANGNIYFSDELDSISRLTPDGTMNTIAGGHGVGFSGDGGPAADAQLHGPVGMLVAGGDLYFSDFGSRRVRRINDVDACPVVAGPQIVRHGILNAASFASGTPYGRFPRNGLAPGTIFTLFGSRLGPEQGVSAQVQQKARLTTELAGTRVFVDGIPAPMVFASANQVSAIVPYGIEFTGVFNEQGRFVPKESLPATVEYAGVVSDGEPISPVLQSPGIFTLDASGQGLAAALNQDGTVNGPFNPAPIGTVIVLFATGEGQTDPPGIDGMLAEAPFPKPLIDVKVFLGGQPVQTLYAGGAPGLTAGLMQVNVMIPPSFEKRGPVPVQLVMGASKTDPLDVVVIIGE